MPKEMSPAARKRISEAQKRRWAARRQQTVSNPPSTAQDASTRASGTYRGRAIIERNGTILIQRFTVKSWGELIDIVWGNADIVEVVMSKD